ncbi:hydroxyacylglutathione hydrolase [Shewanella corallii]|uniref:Hydroxyacylglutathione hydrolase n=1 Tax=Shewanella corallii TaxID=560080 RepID=A0ABT0N944_9GAMM|nr:hydroxyacylglutathione hydrolase [Shewanella corallii]MCL2914882.1 hydroxyacylglutathione hydrolase [Shewanella corallii]
MLLNVTAIPAFDDNYIWCLTQSGSPQAWVVDPGQAKPVIAYLEQEQLTLSGILITHHHWDHTSGINDLSARYPDIEVYGPANPEINGLTQELKDGQMVNLKGLDIQARVLTVPGHTLDHIAYVCDDRLFCGDTLFSGGCGRMFEGEPAQFHHSLSRLAALPANTRVYCAHEYTLSNLKFALMADPDNTELKAYQQECEALRAKGIPTLPSSIGKELAVNPFLRVDQKQVCQQINQHWQQNPADNVEAFALLRRWKDNA